MEGDIIGDNGNWMVYEFLSTPSAWRATLCPLHPKASRGISIHALRMEGDRNASCPRIRQQISIHALRMEGDNKMIFKSCKKFISIHALRMEGDNAWAELGFKKDISIHALRMEGDIGADRQNDGSIHFYPRPPHGGRPAVTILDERIFLFLSTPSAWRATRCP